MTPEPNLDIDTYNVKFAQLRTRSLELARCVVPIFVQTGLTFSYIGSSIYVRVGDTEWLVSAGHVFSELGGKAVACPQSYELMMQISTDKFMISRIAIADVGVCRLLSELPFYRPVDLFSIRGFEPSSKLLYLFAGFPGSRTKTRVANIRSELMVYISEESNLDYYDFLSVERKSSLLFDFGKDVAYGMDIKKITFPDLFGMSGGAVFYFVPEFARNFTLGGIITHWHQGKNECVQALNIEYAMSMILEQEITGFPELRLNYLKMIRSSPPQPSTLSTIEPSKG